MNNLINILVRVCLYFIGFAGILGVLKVFLQFSLKVSLKNKHFVVKKKHFFVKFPVKSVKFLKYLRNMLIVVYKDVEKANI